MALKIVGHVPGGGGSLGGGDVTFNTVCKYLSGRGHRVTVLLDKGESEATQGYKVVAGARTSKVLSLYRSADVLLTQRRSALQPLRELAIGHGCTRSDGLPARVFLAHNVGQPRIYGFASEDLDLVVFNAVSTKEETQWPGQSIVLHPPVFPEDYRTEPGDLITQMNLSEKKGGRFFWELVHRLPQRKFLAVLGKEDSQVIPDPTPSNCEVIGNTPNVRDDVYRRTRVLLVPSVGVQGREHRAYKKSAESWGRVGIEAAASGIPTIAVPTSGLKESLGPAGCFLDHDVDAWSREIERLLSDSDYYRARSDEARKRSALLHPRVQLEALERRLLDLASSREWSPRRRPAA